jgi:hypothetical protein
LRDDEGISGEENHKFLVWIELPSGLGERPCLKETRLATYEVSFT